MPRESVITAHSSRFGNYNNPPTKIAKFIQVSQIFGFNVDLERSLRDLGFNRYSLTFTRRLGHVSQNGEDDEFCVEHCVDCVFVVRR